MKTLRKNTNLTFFLVLLVAMSLVISCGAAPGTNTPVIVPTNTPISLLSTPTLVPTLAEASQTPEPVLTQTSVPTPTETINSYDKSVLTGEQKEFLYQTSLRFIANTEEEAFEIGIYLDYSNYGHPGYVCGPLASGILRDAGLLNADITIKDFWLLNPRDEYTVTSILEKYFPRENYLWFKTDTALDKFDFNEFPLFTGDFLYIYSGYLGTYEHMMSVSKVDVEGRVFAISNHWSEDDFYVIQEFMLYDPNEPGVGYFYEIADRSKSSGITGFGGFSLWRPTTPIISP